MQPNKRSKKDEYWRYKGEQDRVHNRGYHQPHGWLSNLLTWSVSGMRKIREDNESYHRGWSYRRIETK